MKYKVLSVRQPYASLLVSGEKNVENRSRRTNYRGRVLIHASAKMHDIIPALEKIKKHGVKFSPFHKKIFDAAENCEFSAIIGCVDIVDCVDCNTHTSLSEWAEGGCFWWICRNARLFDKPILGVKGKLGIWEWEGEIPELEEQL